MIFFNCWLYKQKQCNKWSFNRSENCLVIKYKMYLLIAMKDNSFSNTNNLQINVNEINKEPR